MLLSRSDVGMAFYLSVPPIRPWGRPRQMYRSFVFLGGMMATRKQDIVAEIMYDAYIRVFSDLAKNQIESIEGVTHAMHFSAIGCYHVQTDPRYDIREIRNEIVAMAQG